MNDFFKQVLATIVGIIILSAVSLILTIVTVATLASASGSKDIENNSLLVLKLDGGIEERAQDNPFADIMGSAAQTTGLNDILQALQKAKDNDKVKGLYIEAGTFRGATPAMLQEIRQAILDFKKSGKPVIAYGDTYTQGAYYLASTADSLVVNPQGSINWCGLSTQTAYYKDLLDKLGVKMEIFKVGTYKSAVEPYFLNEMSEANREQITTFNNEIWTQMLTEVGKSRKLTNEKLNQLADTFMLLQEAAYYKKHNLVDKLAYTTEVPQIIANTLGLDSKDDYNTVSIGEMAAAANSEPKGKSGNLVAVYYASGNIVDKPAAGLTGVSEIVGADVVSDLQELAEDDDIDAVVLRVNSPGGSAYASEQIWHAVKMLKEKKPVVVSMGGYAASGGYYISCGADWIVAEPTTLTGSIGIFGVFPTAQKLLNDKLGVHLQAVKTNSLSDFGDVSREMNEGEKNIMQNYVNRGYELFTKRCADGRKMKQDAIKAIAEGRVWTGVHAKSIGLVDQLGNLNDAIKQAAKRAKVSEYSVINEPAQPSFIESLMESANRSSYADAKIRKMLGDHANFFDVLNRINGKGSVQAEIPCYFIFNL